MKTEFLVLFIMGFVVSLMLGIYSFFKVSSTTGRTSLPENGVHWHPQLTIMIKGEQMTIPSNLGITVGNSIDHHISGMMMSPIHTHDTTGVLHMESRNPSQKPETLTLGYFFNDVWEVKFSDKCVLDYCSDNGNLKMFVNGRENKEFGDYLMKDGDNIVIVFE